MTHIWYVQMLSNQNFDWKIYFKNYLFTSSLFHTSHLEKPKLKSSKAWDLKRFLTFCSRILSLHIVYFHPSNVFTECKFLISYMWERQLWPSAFGFDCICSASPLCYHVWVWRALIDASGKGSMLLFFVHTEWKSEYKWCISCLDLIWWLLSILVHQRVVSH